ncbi:hypothetical protein HID58_016078 [Brassica napus]|uniref:BnaA04g20670D protein n=3 Tax=Brassica TaxID=3705 RepID=A0A078HPH4_BRANA|nr:hypothetical protein HID58_016078 [Brassica napus]CAF2291366.1 unnamed protein product [Brassica napus]CAG7907929.1 unnamed protein product [Brassica rapa]CDY40450.1 BnaA04g20670D [Brassica napus]VDD14929.1 unnamed protein product [Brassica rapa]
MSNSSFSNQNQALGRKVEKMSTQLGAEVAVITYRRDGECYEHASPSVSAVLDRFYDPAPEPIIAIHKQLALLNVDKLTLAEINDLETRLMGVATDIQARLG